MSANRPARRDAFQRAYGYVSEVLTCWAIEGGNTTARAVRTEFTSGAAEHFAARPVHARIIRNVAADALACGYFAAAARHWGHVGTPRGMRYLQRAMARMAHVASF